MILTRKKKKKSLEEGQEEKDPSITAITNERRRKRKRKKEKAGRPVARSASVASAPPIAGNSEPENRPLLGYLFSLFLLYFYSPSPSHPRCLIFKTSSLLDDLLRRGFQELTQRQRLRQSAWRRPLRSPRYPRDRSYFLSLSLSLSLCLSPSLFPFSLSFFSRFLYTLFLFIIRLPPHPYVLSPSSASHFIISVRRFCD